MTQETILRDFARRVVGLSRWPVFVCAYRWGLGVRIGRHYWHLRRDPLDVYSERYRVACRWWQAGRWRLTHRWSGV